MSPTSQVRKGVETALAADHAADVVEKIALRGCLQRPPTERERLAQRLYERLHPVMAMLGVLFVAVVLGQLAAEPASALHGVLVGVSWLLWAAFVVEYVLRLVIAPSTAAFLRRTWWQILFLLVPALSSLRLVLFLRVGRVTRVVLAAVRGSRSARTKLTNRLGWLGVVTAIVVFTTADLVYEYGDVRPYGVALHGAAKAAIAAEAMPGRAGIVQVLDVVVGAYSMVVFAAVAGALGAYFLERRDESKEVLRDYAATSSDGSPRSARRRARSSVSSATAAGASPSSS